LFSKLLPGLYLLTVFLPMPALAASQHSCLSKLDNIHVAGNKVTQIENLIKWSGLNTGQMFSPQHLSSARQKLLETGLYSLVEIQADAPCAANTTVTINIEEKHYHFVYPRINRNGDGDISRGLKYKANNLFGADQTLTLSLAKKDYATGESADQLGLYYELPMFDRPYLFRWSIRSEEILLSDTLETVTEDYQSLRFSIGRDWHTASLPNPVTILATVKASEKILDGSDPAVTLHPGHFHALGFTLEYDNVHDETVRRYGHFLALDYTKGFKFLNSDFTATQVKIESRNYKRLNELDNLNTRFIAAFSTDKLFNEFI